MNSNTDYPIRGSVLFDDDGLAFGSRRKSRSAGSLSFSLLSGGLVSLVAACPSGGSGGVGDGAEGAEKDDATEASGIQSLGKSLKPFSVVETITHKELGVTLGGDGSKKDYEINPTTVRTSAGQIKLALEKKGG